MLGIVECKFLNRWVIPCFNLIVTTVIIYLDFSNPKIEYLKIQFDLFLLLAKFYFLLIIIFIILIYHLDLLIIIVIIILDNKKLFLIIITKFLSLQQMVINFHVTNHNVDIQIFQ